MISTVTEIITKLMREQTAITMQFLAGELTENEMQDAIDELGAMTIAELLAVKV